MRVIAKNTIKEFLRNRLIYILVWVSILFLLGSLIVINLALTEWAKVLIDFNLSFIEVFGLIATLFLWSYLIYNEINKNTILIILSKNPSRKDFVLGKFFGFAIVLWLIYLFLSFTFGVVMLLASYFFQLEINFGYFYIILAILFSYVKILVVLAFLIFFSTFISPFVSLLLTLAIYIIAHMTPFMKFYVYWKTKWEWIINYFTGLIYYIFPNFQDLSLAEYLLSPNLWNYSIFHISLTFLSNIFYIAILLLFAILIFKKKEF